ncbi:MAG TPA: hypothetical protein VF901_27625 [Bradyrhizobium sp.]
MGNRTARFISTLVASIVAGAPLAAVSQDAPSQPAATSTANAASDCLASPKGAAPEGQHWYYRLERSTKRQCWYVRAEGGKTATTTQTANSAQQPDSPAPQSVQDAHAEYIAPQSGAAQPATAPQAASTTADSNAQQPAVAARWPDAAMAAAAPAPQPAAAPATSDARPGAKPAASPAPVTLAAADAPADKPTGSLQMLLLVIGGALALAGLLASIIYRFAGGRVRIPAGDRRVNWDHREPQQHDDSRAPWLDAAPARAPRAERPRPVDFDAARLQAPQIAAFADAIGRVAAQARSTDVAAAEPDETEIETFDREFEIEASAPQLAANDADDEAPAVRNEAARNDDAVYIDIITTMLERLMNEGPRLTQPNPEADLADLAQSRRGQSAARA